MPRGPIVLVDDDPDSRELSTRKLARAGYEVVSVASWEALERALDSRTPSLVLMDVNMPEIFGDDVAAVLRGRRLTCPIYLYSSLDEQDLRSRAAEAELDGYICKTAGLDHLAQRVRDIVGE